MKSLPASSSSTFSATEESLNSQTKSAASSKWRLFVSSANRTIIGSSTKFFSVVLFAVALAGCYVLLSSTSSRAASNHASTTEIHQTLHQDERGKNKVPSTSAASASAAAAAASDFQATVATLRARFIAAREKMVAKLHQDYGAPAAAAVFRVHDAQSVSVARGLFRSGDPGSSTASWDRAKRKLVMKLLNVATASSAGSSARAGSSSNSSSRTGKTTTFIWATGGHSAAAGHGNFYDESYTAHMEHTVKDIFAALGMEFIGRNYAMGGTGAAMEVALCSDQIFGLDADVVSWDFGMTDGSKFPWKQELFHRRTVGSNPNRPFGVALGCGGRARKSRSEVARDLENLGLAVLLEDEDVKTQIIESIPDSFGKTDQELDAMPLFIRNMRCGDQIEMGEPYCRAEKFNQTDCIKRKFQAKWHPGWKFQAVKGNLLALFLVELLEDALKDLAAASAGDPAALFQTLKASEDSDYEKYETAHIDPELFSKSIEKNDHEGFDFTLLTTGHMFCHTARLPAEIRHKGILTESTKTGFTTFDTGIPLREALVPDASSSLMRLVYEPNDRQKCPIPTNMDYKDFFLVSGAEGWRSLILPNNAELKEYGKGQERPNLKGYVTICLSMCPWGKCPQHVLQRDDFFEGKIELTVNGKPADRLTHFVDCEVLHSAESGYTWQPNADGRFEVGVRVTEKANAADFLRISAIILW